MSQRMDKDGRRFRHHLDEAGCPTWCAHEWPAETHGASDHVVSVILLVENDASAQGQPNDLDASVIRGAGR